MSNLSSATLSLRVPNDLKSRLERASLRTHRSRAYLTIAALKKYLNEVEMEEAKTSSPSNYAIAERYKGIGAKMLGKGRSAIEIDTIIRDLRGDE
jgi:hypothetical protein